MCSRCQHAGIIYFLVLIMLHFLCIMHHNTNHSLQQLPQIVSQQPSQMSPSHIINKQSSQAYLHVIVRSEKGFRRQLKLMMHTYLTIPEKLEFLLCYPINVNDTESEMLWDTLRPITKYVENHCLVAYDTNTSRYVVPFSYHIWSNA